MIDIKYVRRFSELFQGRNDVYALRVNNIFIPIRRYWDDDVVTAHLEGRHVVGLYPILDHEFTRILCVDEDNNDFAAVLQYHDRSWEGGYPCYIEQSQSKGYHIWTFFSKKVTAYKARELAWNILEHTPLPGDIEVYPRQIWTENLGNLIALPLGDPNGRRVFVGRDNQMIPDQLEYLMEIKQV